MEDNKELLTAKESAKISNKSQQEIYKQLNNRLNPFIQLVDNQKMLERRALKEVFGIEVEQPIQPKLNNQFNQENPLYKILKDELEAKNCQIEELQKELSKEREHSREQSEKMSILADQAQKLQLAQMKPQLTEGVADLQAEAPPKKKHWWQK